MEDEHLQVGQEVLSRAGDPGIAQLPWVQLGRSDRRHPGLRPRQVRAALHADGLRMPGGVLLPRAHCQVGAVPIRVAQVLLGRADDGPGHDGGSLARRLRPVRGRHLQEWELVPPLPLALVLPGRELARSGVPGRLQDGRHGAVGGRAVRVRAGPGDQAGRDVVRVPAVLQGLHLPAQRGQAPRGVPRREHHYHHRRDALQFMQVQRGVQGHLRAVRDLPIAVLVPRRKLAALLRKRCQLSGWVEDVLGLRVQRGREALLPDPGLPAVVRDLPVPQPQPLRRREDLQQRRELPRVHGGARGHLGADVPRVCGPHGGRQVRRRPQERRQQQMVVLQADRVPEAHGAWRNLLQGRYGPVARCPAAMHFVRGGCRKHPQ
mmetsp:Transcript_42506/g.101145  ORF Transcript_42506/g.101145 Transcript_42506/m.101145 type:complete len:376 (+) Transcript_42506:2730-3857(+)